jgi:tetratricopeptide (TPR) repeat protein
MSATADPASRRTVPANLPWRFVALVALVLAGLGAAGCSNEPPSDGLPGEGGAPGAAARPLAPLVPDPPLEVREVAVPGPDPLPDSPVGGLQAAVEQDPADAAAHRQLAVALFRAERRLESLEHFERAARLAPTPERLMELAGAYSFAGHLDQAVATYERVILAQPTLAAALYNCGNATLQQGDVDGAIELYRRALERQPQYLVAWYQLGQAYKARADLAQDDLRNAYRAFGKVLEHETSDPDEARALDDALYEMAALDVMMGAYPRAEEMLRALLEISPDHPAGHYGLALLLMRMDRVDEAQAELAAHLDIMGKFRPAGQVAAAR